MPAPIDNESYYVRCKELLHNNTALKDPQLNILARNLADLLSNFNATSRTTIGDPNELALISCRRTNEVKWFLTLVKSSGSQVELIIKGDAMPSRNEAAGGFMTRVEWLLWRKVGNKHAWIE